MTATAAAQTRATGTAMRTVDECLLLVFAPDVDAEAEAEDEAFGPEPPDGLCCEPVVLVANVDADAEGFDVVAVYESPTTPMIVWATPADTVTRGSVAQSQLDEEPVAQQYLSPPQLVISPEVSP
jgi:hypothetical protein